MYMKVEIVRITVFCSPQHKSFVSSLQSQFIHLMPLYHAEDLIVWLQISCPPPFPMLCFTLYINATTILVHLLWLCMVWIWSTLSDLCGRSQWRDQVGSQANTPEAWVFHLTLIYNRVTHVCSVDVCPAQVMAAQHASYEGDPGGQKICDLWFSSPLSALGKRWP